MLGKEGRVMGWGLGRGHLGVILVSVFQDSLYALYTRYCLSKSHQMLFLSRYILSFDSMLVLYLFYISTVLALY